MDDVFHARLDTFQFPIQHMQKGVSKGKTDHARMGIGGVLISLTLAMSP